MFTCPRCQRELSPVRTSTLQFHLCRACGGRAIPWAFISRQFDRHLVNRLWSDATAPDAPRGLACPCCRRPAQRVFKRTYEKTTELDLCPRCKILWCDQGEFEELGQPALAAAHPNEFPSKVQEMIAGYEARHVEVREKYRSSASDSEGVQLEELPDEAWKWPLLLLGVPMELEDPGLTRWPWGTWGIAALCVLVAFLTWAGDFEVIVQLFGFVPAMLFTNLPHALMTTISSFFLHDDFFHLFGNMWFLVIMGDNTEDDLGTKNFLLLLLAATVLGDLVHALGAPRSEIPAIGASAGISGVIAYYMLRFPYARIGFMIFPLMRVISMPVYYWVGLWLVVQSILAFFQLEGATEVSALSHLGGFLAGVVAWLWVTYGSGLALRAAKRTGGLRR